MMESSPTYYLYTFEPSFCHLSTLRRYALYSLCQVFVETFPASVRISYNSHQQTEGRYIWICLYTVETLFLKIDPKLLLERAAEQQGLLPCHVREFIRREDTKWMLFPLTLLLPGIFGC